ncbi:MAG: hypothetical protein EA403_09525 [Spirochaetaceae bacterium]|nr:MAG: hypothetical protein EA403_09525 [Spirochaetaceae bacterium]
MKRSSLIVVLLVAVTIGATAQIRVNTSHSGAIRTLLHDARTGRLLTGGDDGKLKVWDYSAGELQRSIQISSLAIHQGTLHPSLPQVALLVTDGRRRFTLEVWDWEQERRLFTQTLPEAPIFLTYSPRGTFLLFAQNEFNSLRFLASSTGRSLPYLRRGSGIVTFATVASSEERIMTYTPSDGVITYWEVVSGRQVQTISTAREIDQLSVHTNRRFAVGRLDNELVVVDIVDGTLRDRFPMSGIERILVNQVNGDVAVMTRSGRQIEMASFRVSERGRLSRAMSTVPTLPSGLTQATLHGDALFVATGDGTITTFESTDRRGRTIAENRVQSVTGFAFTEGTVHLSTAQQILSLRSDLFGETDVAVNRVRTLDVTTRRMPQPGTVRLSAVTGPDSDESRVVVWDTSGRNPELATYAAVAPALTTIPLDSARVTKQVVSADGRLIVLHDQTTLRRIDPDTGSTDFTYTGEGMEALVAVGDTIVIGKNRANPFDSALMRVDTRTGETVRIQSDNFLIFDLVYDRARGVLYTLGLQQSGSVVRTTVTVHRGANFENRRTISTYDGEDLDARLSLDPATGRLFSSLGMEGVSVWDGRRLTRISAVAHVPRALYVANRHLFSINRDGTMSVWDLRSGDPLLTFYLFRDGNWVAVTTDGYYFASHSRAEQHLSLLAAPGRTGRRRTLEDFRLILPTTARDA